MKDLYIIIVFLAVICTTLIFLLGFMFHLRIKALSKTLEKKYFKSLQKKDLPWFYCTQSIRHIALRKIFRLSPKIEDVLAAAAIKNIYKAQPLIANALKKYKKNKKLLILDAEISVLTHNRSRFRHILTTFEIKPFTKKTKAKLLWLNAQHELYQTDMMSASMHASKALKIYQKLNYSYEEAQCYQLLSQIYRISGLFDVAFNMLKEAEKIFKNLKLYAKTAETKAYFGMIELGRENYDVAIEYLENAAKISKLHQLNNTLADISNWQGLVFYLKPKLLKAKNCFTQTIKISSKPPSLAFAFEMMARISLKQKDESNALSYIDKALEFSHKAKLDAAIFENLYLKAEIYYNRCQYDDSKNILTQLIKQKRPPSTVYYPANAYTLLGLIELKQNNLSLAQTLFQQALDLEHSQNRLKGAIIDYNNLAETARRNQDIPKAREYLQQALSYAEKIEDKDLIKSLTEKLNYTI